MVLVPDLSWVSFGRPEDVAVVPVVVSAPPRSEFNECALEDSVPDIVDDFIVDVCAPLVGHFILFHTILTEVYGDDIPATDGTTSDDAEACNSVLVLTKDDRVSDNVYEAAKHVWIQMVATLAKPHLRKDPFTHTIIHNWLQHLDWVVDGIIDVPTLSELITLIFIPDVADAWSRCLVEADDPIGAVSDFEISLCDFIRLDYLKT